MKRLTLVFGLIVILVIMANIMTSCRDSKRMKELKEYHAVFVGKDSVERFHLKYPTIVNNDAVYVAYLQDKHYRDSLVNLMK